MLISLRHVGLLILCLVCIFSVNAQTDLPTPIPTVDALDLDTVDAFIIASDEQVELGEPFTISMIVDTPANTIIESFPELPDVAYLEIVNADIWSSTQVGNRVTHRQELEITLWRTGRYLSPEIFVVYRVEGQEAKSAPVRSFTVFVPRTIQDPDNTEMRPSVPPIRLPYTSPWFYAAIASAIVAVIWIGLYLFDLITAPSGGRTVVVRQRGTPAQVSIAQLEDLQIQNLPATTIYPAVAAILRLYLQVQHQVETAELTTMELFEVVRRDKLFERQHETALEDIFNQSDLVKFANFQPEANSSKRLIETTILWLRDDEAKLIEGGGTTRTLNMRKLDDWEDLDTVEARLKDIWQEGYAPPDKGDK